MKKVRNSYILRSERRSSSGQAMNKRKVCMALNEPVHEVPREGMTIHVPQYSSWKPVGILCGKNQKSYFTLHKHKAEFDSEEVFASHSDPSCFTCT